nr:MAG TPA: hypothetical protein [Caudoviricetes sp.]
MFYTFVYLFYNKVRTISFVTYLRTTNSHFGLNLLTCVIVSGLTS